MGIGEYGGPGDHALFLRHGGSRRGRARTKKENPTAECSPGGVCFRGGNLHDRRIIMPQLEFRAIRAVTPRWLLDIMGRGGSSAEGRKTTDLRRCGGACRHVCFCAAKGSSSGLRRGAGVGTQKKRPPRNCPQGAGSFVRGGNLLSHTRVQYHRRGRA